MSNEAVLSGLLSKISKCLPFVLCVSVPVVAFCAYGGDVVWTKQIAIAITLFLSMAISAPLWIARRLKESTPPESALLLVFSCWAVLSSTWALNPNKSLKLVTLLFIALASFELARLAFDSTVKAKCFLGISLSTGALVSLFGILQFHLDAGVFEMPRDQFGFKDPTGTFGLSNFTVDVLVMILPFGLVGLRAFERKAFRYLGALGASLILYYMIISRVRAGYIALVAMALGYLAIFVIRKFKVTGVSVRRIIFASGLLFFGACLGIVTFLPDRAGLPESLQSEFLQQPTVKIRLHTWRQAINLIQDNPFLGVGLGNYEVHSGRYLDTVQEQMTSHSNTRIDRTHNDYFNVACDLGLVGLALLLTFVVVLLAGGFELIRRTRESPLLWIASGLTLGILGGLANAFFTFPFQMPGSVYIFFLTAGALSGLSINRASKLPKTDKTAAAWRSTPSYIVVVLLLLAAGFSLFWSARFMLAERYYRSGQQAVENDELQGLKDFDSALYFEPFAARVFFERSMLLRDLGRTREAANSMALCLEELPFLGRARKEYGALLLETGELDQARTEFEKALGLHPSGAPGTHLYLGSLFLLEGQRDLAFSSFSLALENGQPEKRAMRTALRVLNEVDGSGPSLDPQFRQIWEVLERETAPRRRRLRSHPGRP